MEKIKLILVEDRAEWIKTFEEEILKDFRFAYLGYASSKESAVEMACKRLTIQACWETALFPNAKQRSIKNWG